MEGGGGGGGVFCQVKIHNHFETESTLRIKTVDILEVFVIDARTDTHTDRRRQQQYLKAKTDLG